MRRSTLLARAATAVTALGTALTGAVVLTTSPAQAVLRETNYTFQTSNWGTRVTAKDVSLRSDRTGWAVLGCTRLAGIRGTVSQASLDSSQTGNPMIDVGMVRSTKRTYRNLRHGVSAGVVGRNRIAQVVLGNAGMGTPVLTIDGLRSTARTWADTDGSLHAKTGLALGSISLTGVDASQVTQPLNDLLSAIQSQVLDNIISVLGQNQNGIEIPGLGRIYLPGDQYSFRREVVKANTAYAGVKALRIVLYGQDGIEGTADDSTVVIGRAFSRISRSPAAVFAGNAYGISAQVAQGLVGIGKVAVRPLNCAGTGGRVATSYTAGVDVMNLGMVKTGDVAGYAYGKQYSDGAANAWTKGEVANLTLSDGGSNSLTITAITGRAHVRQYRNGNLAPAPPALQSQGVKYGDIKGTKIVGVYVNGVDQGDFVPGDTLEVPGLARIVFGEVKPLRRGLQVIAAHVYILPGAISDAGIAEVELGVARVKIKKY